MSSLELLVGLYIVVYAIVSAAEILAYVTDAGY